jgi:SAM-dependent methyltransferase
VRGITLSPFQCRRAQLLTRQAGLEDTARFQVADALAMPFADKTFDLVWSMESGEHMPDKAQFVRELVRVAAPGGKVIVVTWCVVVFCFSGGLVGLMSRSNDEQEGGEGQQDQWSRSRAME